MLCVKIYSRNKCFATTSASQITLNLHFPCVLFLEFQDFYLRACGQQVLNCEKFRKTSRLLNPYLWNSRISNSFWIICGTDVREYCEKNNVWVRNVAWVVWRRKAGLYDALSNADKITSHNGHSHYYHFFALHTTPSLFLPARVGYWLPSEPYWPEAPTGRLPRLLVIQLVMAKWFNIIWPG